MGNIMTPEKSTTSFVQTHKGKDPLSWGWQNLVRKGEMYAEESWALPKFGKGLLSGKKLTHPNATPFYNDRGGWVPLTSYDYSPQIFTCATHLTATKRMNQQN